ncbi:MAG: hypothetical protein AB8H79_12465 [Myxococcota bacterium]
MRKSVMLMAMLAAGAGSAVIASSAWANGVFGSDAPSRIPVPARTFSATFEDVGGTQVKASRVTLNGEVFVYGKLGSAQVTVPFERIKDVRIEKATNPLKRVAVVTLTDDTTPVRIEVDDDTAWFGKARFGNYKLEMRDLRVVSGFSLQATP